MVISHPLLKGIEWACGLKTALSSRKKFGFLDGSIKRPEEGSPDLEDWWKIQALLVSWIKMTIDPVLRSNISHREVAQDLWDHLKKHFSVTNGPMIQQIKAEFACCKQKGLAIETYFGKLTRIWDSMSTYRPLRLCKYGKYECDLGTIKEKDREEDKVHQFLFGLDESLFRTGRSSLVSSISIQPMEEVYNIVHQEEDLVRNGTKSVEDQQDVAAFGVQTRSLFRKEDRDKFVLCKHCNRALYSSDSCYAIIGYPEWWGDRPRSRSTQGCGRGGGGGIASMTRRGHGGVSYVNVVHVSAPVNSEHVNYLTTDKDRDRVTGLSDDQWRGIMNLLNADKTNHTECLSGKNYFLSWILDTGASHHLIGRLEILSYVKEMYVSKLRKQGPLFRVA